MAKKTVKKAVSPKTLYISKSHYGDRDCYSTAREAFEGGQNVVWEYQLVRKVKLVVSVEEDKK